MMTQTALFLVLLSSTVFAAINKFTCDNERPMEGSNVICKCVTSNDMEWQLNDVALSQCTTTGICSPKPAGYVFETNTNNPDKEYSLTVQQYDYSSCSVYSCTDLNTTEEQQITLSVAAFNSTSPSVIVEPGSHKNGKIEITTECLFKETDIVVKWYSVDEDDEEELYTTGERFQTSTDCTDNCNGEASVRLNIGFTHTEDEESRYTQNVKFRLKVYHKEDPTNVLDLKTSSEYKIKGKYQCNPMWEGEFKNSAHICASIWFAIIFCPIYFVGLVIIGNCLGCILIDCAPCCCDSFYDKESCKNCCNNSCCGGCYTTRLPYWYQVLWKSVIGSSVAFGIWVVWKCSNKIKRWNWISIPNRVYSRINEKAVLPFDMSKYTGPKNSITFNIVFENVTVVALVSYENGEVTTTQPQPGYSVTAYPAGKVELTIQNVEDNKKGKYSISGGGSPVRCTYLYILGKRDKGDTSRDVESTSSSPKNANSKLLNKDKQNSATGKAEGMNKGKHVSDTQIHPDDKVHSENEGKSFRPQPPLPPSGTNINQSQLPNIPGHDKKGRGLSSNFEDDDHPLVDIDIPAQKAGALPTITDTPRETKKKTKKKKKDKQEDNQNTETVLDF